MKKILIIEDDLDIQRMYFEKLSMLNYKIFLAVDSTHGIQICREENPNLVLLDIMLPGKMNGLELLKKLKNDDKVKNTPIIVLTNLDTEKDSAMELGANDYLLKSATDLNELTEKVKKNVK